MSQMTNDSHMEAQTYCSYMGKTILSVDMQQPPTQQRVFDLILLLMMMLMGYFSIYVLLFPTLWSTVPE